MHKQTKQQQETLEYFTKYAKKWRRKVDSPIDNTIKQRDNYILNIIKQNKSQIKNILDIGCGNGGLTCIISKKGINITGIDFSKEMIKIAKNNSKKYKCKTVTFEHYSIFDFPVQSNTYDLVFANGFIEYISFKELIQFLKICFKSLKNGGLLIISSRNRLFNLFSLNEFTKREIKAGTIKSLLYESTLLASCRNTKQLLKNKVGIPTSKDKKQPYTGIDVSIRYQYTPLQLIKILQSKGFIPVDISPVHIHGSPPIFKKNHLNIHNYISCLLQNYPNHLSLIPFASSFMICSKKVI